MALPILLSARTHRLTESKPVALESDCHSLPGAWGSAAVHNRSPFPVFSDLGAFLNQDATPGMSRRGDEEGERFLPKFWKDSPRAKASPFTHSFMHSAAVGRVGA